MQEVQILGDGRFAEALRSITDGQRWELNEEENFHMGYTPDEDYSEIERSLDNSFCDVRLYIIEELEEKRAIRMSERFTTVLKYGNRYFLIANRYLMTIGDEDEWHDIL